MTYDHVALECTGEVFAGHARDVTLRNVKVVLGAGRQAYWGHALEAHYMQGFNWKGFEVRSGRDGLPDQRVD